MSKQLVLFAGLHKTGTTSIQKTCAKNARAILDAGFHYPVILFPGKKVDNHSPAIHLMFRNEPHKGGYARTQIQENSAALLELGSRLRDSFSLSVLDSPAKVLLVAEGASLLSVDELADMKRWFNERGRDIRVICYVRRLSSWINSMISQRVTGLMHQSIRSAVSEFLEASGVIRPRVANIQEVFSEAEFYSYEAALRHAFGPVGFLFETIGISRLENMTFIRANDGRSDCATRLLSSIHETLAATYTKRTTELVSIINGLSELNTIPGPRFSLRLDEVSPLMSMLAEENEWLKDTLGENFYDNDLVFGNEPCAWPEESLARLRDISHASIPAVRSLISSHLAKFETAKITKTA